MTFDVVHSTGIITVETLGDVIQTAKEIPEFVTIRGNGIEFLGRFGYDSIIKDELPDGSQYEWKKRVE